MNRQTLLTALEAVKPGLANKKVEVIEQSTSFAFIKNMVVTYNDEISISYPIEGLNITGAIKADRLYALLSKLKQDEIDITHDANELIISAGRTKAGFAFDAEIKLPLIHTKITTKLKFKPIPEKFVDNLKLTIPICGTDSNRPILTCVHINKNGLMEGCDNFRIIRTQLATELPINTFLLPASSANILIKMGPTEMAESQGWVHFKTGNNAIISCRIFEDDYPNTNAFFNITGQSLTFPKTINDVLDRAIVCAKRDKAIDEIVIIDIEKGKFKMSSSDVRGWFKEELNYSYNGDPISFVITPYLFKYIVSQTLNCVYNEAKLKFEGENWTYVMSLRT